METARARLFIEGRVQGVFYRDFTRNIANRLELSGWARNLYDGRVEVVFEGSRELIEQAIKECRKGPSTSNVININVTWEEFSGESKGFLIKY